MDTHGRYFTLFCDPWLWSRATIPIWKRVYSKRNECAPSLHQTPFQKKTNQFWQSCLPWKYINSLTIYWDHTILLLKPKFWTILFYMLLHVDVSTYSWSRDYKTRFMLSWAEHEIFSANKYENANNSWHFHIYYQRNFHDQLCLAKTNLQLLVLWDLSAEQISCSAELST